MDTTTSTAQPTKRYRVRHWLAKDRGIPREFVAVETRRTRKAVFLYGRGTDQAHSSCMNCGRELTHPVSVLLGIGPECGRHYWNEAALGPYGFTEAHAEQLRQMVRDIVVDCCVPLSAIEWIKDTDERVELPREHAERAEAVQREPTDATRDRKLLFTRSPEDEWFVQVQWGVRDPEFDVFRVRVKEFEKWKWHKDKKVWRAPLTLNNVLRLREYWTDFEWSPNLRAACDRVWARTFKPVASVNHIQGFRGELRDFQREGVSFLESRDGCALLGDDMGLGKTVQAAAWLQLRWEDALPALVVCPSSLKLNWARELRKFTELTVAVVGGRYNELNSVEPGVAEVYVVNYDVLAVPSVCEKCNGEGKYINTKGLEQKCKRCKGTGKDVALRPDLEQLGIRTVILDECQYIKNYDTQRSRAVALLGRLAAHRMGLSGTPIENRPVEFFPTLNFIDPQQWNSWWKFVHRYCGAEQGRYGWDFSGASNVEELHHVLTSTRMVRRTKDEVLKDLPPKQRSVVPVEIDNRDEYNAAAEDYIEYLRGVNPEKVSKAERAKALVRINGLKRLCIQGKLAGCIEWIEDYLNGDRKLVVFSLHLDVLDALEERFGEMAVRVDGGVSGPARQDAVDAFQENPEKRLFLGQLKAAGVGLTLTAASATVTLELGWNPSAHDQAEDRVHRIGQQADSVMAYYLVASGTIDEDLADLIDAKRETIRAILDGEEVENSSLFKALLHQGLQRAHENDFEGTYIGRASSRENG